MKRENKEGIKGPQATRNKKLKEKMDEAAIVHESLETWVLYVVYRPPDLVWQAPRAWKSSIQVTLSCEACGPARLV